MSASGEELFPTVARRAETRIGRASKTMVLAYIALWILSTPSDVAPLHEQVAAQIRRALAEGEAKPGERLPPARDLATVLGVNANTVLRALRDLRDEGLVEFRRGRGITVTSAAPSRSAVILSAKDLLHLARHQGLRRDELVAIIEGLP